MGMNSLRIKSIILVLACLAVGCRDKKSSAGEITNMDRDFMAMAINAASQSAMNGGGPFGAVIVKDGKVVALTSNSVTRDNDPTAHAEVNAIREACRALGTYNLSGCILYTSCEPCPMCLGAIYWAHIDCVFHGGTRKDAAKAGFDDAFIYDEISVPTDQRAVPFIPMMRNESLAPFRIWSSNDSKKEY